MSMVPLTRRLAAEALGTFWLVLGGCGSAVLAATFPETGIGWLGVGFAFGLTVPDPAKALFTYSVTIDDRRDRRERLAEGNPTREPPSAVWRAQDRPSFISLPLML